MPTNTLFMQHPGLPKHLIQLIPVFLVLSISSYCYAQHTLDWSIITEKGGVEDVLDVATGAGGSVFATGFFISPTDFDPGPDSAILHSAGASDIFLAKYGPDGNYLWSFNVGGPMGDKGEAIAIDALDNIYLMGTFSGTADFDPGPGISNLTTTSFSSYFIAKYNLIGQFQWAISIINPWNQLEIYSIKVDKNDDLVIGGTFAGTIDFDPGVDTFLVTSFYYTHINAFVAKYSDSGGFKWVKTAGGVYASSKGATATKAGNIVGIGYGNDTIFFDYPVKSKFITGLGSYIVEYNSQGDFQWVKPIAGKDCIPQSVIGDAAGNIYVAGTFQDSAQFGQGTSNIQLLSIGGMDIFLAKYDSMGNQIWVIGIGSRIIDNVYDLTLDASDNPILSGDFGGKMDFDPGPGLVEYTPIDDQDGFVAKYDAQGGFISAIHQGGVNYVRTNAVTSGNSGSTIVAGKYEAWVQLNPCTSEQTQGTPNVSCLFLAQYSSCTTLFDTATFAICGLDTIQLGNQTLTAPGVYTEHFSSQCDCDSLQTFILVPLDAGVVLHPEQVLEATTIGATYQWVDCNNNYTPILGATNFTFHPLVNGSYAVIVSSPTCSDTSACYTITNVGISAPFDPFEVIVYPNPAQEQVFIHFALDKPANAHLQLLDLQGRVVLEKTVTKAAGTRTELLNLHRLANGLYNVFLITERGIANRQLVVQH